MKQFKIVKLTGTTGAVKYQVQHRVQFLGINLWWSNRYAAVEDLEAAYNLVDFVRSAYARENQKWLKQEILTFPEVTPKPSAVNMTEENGLYDGAAQRSKIAELEALSVTHILLDVVPGVHGEGEGVYATSVEDVRNKLTQLAEQMENYELGIESPSVVKETIKGLESELVVCKRDIAVERSSRCMFVSRIENCGTTPMTGEDVLALLNDCDMLASREFDLPSRLEITYGDAAIDAAMAAGEKAS